MRYLAVAIVCLAVGFAGGWAAFGSPFSSDPSKARGPGEAEVRDAVEAEAGGNIKLTTCQREAHPDNVWDCTVYRPFGTANEALPGGNFRATVNGSTIDVKRLGM